MTLGLGFGPILQRKKAFSRVQDPPHSTLKSKILLDLESYRIQESQGREFTGCRVSLKPNSLELYGVVRSVMRR